MQRKLQQLTMLLLTVMEPTYFTGSDLPLLWALGGVTTLFTIFILYQKHLRKKYWKRETMSIGIKHNESNASAINCIYGENSQTTCLLTPNCGSDHVRPQFSTRPPQEPPPVLLSPTNCEIKSDIDELSNRDDNKLQEEKCETTSIRKSHQHCLYQPPLDLVSLVENGRLITNSASSCCSSPMNAASLLDHNSSIALDRFCSSHRSPLSNYLIRETKIDSPTEFDEHYATIQDVHDVITTNNNTSVLNEADGHINHSCNNSNHGDCVVLMASENEDYLTDASDSNPINHECRATIEAAVQTSALEINAQTTVESILVQYAQLEVALLYDAPLRKMTIHVMQAYHVPLKENGQFSNSQIRLLLLPNKKQKHKTRIRAGDNPKFMESFVLHRVNPEDVNSMGVRLRLYSCKRMRRERLIGEATISFSQINLEFHNNLRLPLVPQTADANSSVRLPMNDTAYSASLAGSMEVTSLARSDSTSGSTLSMQHGSSVPELLMALCYNAITGSLTCEIVKGAHFRYLVPINQRLPDAFVKLNLISSSGQLLAQNKTSARRCQSNPLFKEVFMFPVALFQLADVTLMVTVYNRRGMAKRKELLGWFSLGLNSSGAEELAHWMDMKEAQQQWICKWHVLVLS